MLCWFAKKKDFLPEFSNCIDNSSSVARMRAKQKHNQRWRVREREREKGSQGKRLKERSKQKPKEGWPPSPHFILQVPLSTVARAGSHMSVLMYAPTSSLSPFPGPELWWCISMASLILRLYVRRRLFLSCMFVMTEKLFLSNVCWQCW